MRSPPREAPEEMRRAILTALKNDDYSIRQDGDRFLRRLGYSPEAVVQEVIDYLEKGGRMYWLQGQSIRGIKFQCCLYLDEDFVMHVKLIPQEAEHAAAAELHVILDFHRHDTGYQPLPF